MRLFKFGLSVTNFRKVLLAFYLYTPPARCSMPSTQHQCAHIPLPTIQQLERRNLQDRVEAVMDLVHRQRKRIGFPKGFNKRFNEVLKRLNSGDTSRRQVARELGIGYATFKHLLGSRANDGVA